VAEFPGTSRAVVFEKSTLTGSGTIERITVERESSLLNLP
jgi:hypothetical protein